MVVRLSKILLMAAIALWLALVVALVWAYDRFGPFGN